MTEKRSDYRKKQAQKKPKQFFKKMKAAFDDNDIDQEDVNVNPDFQRDSSERRPLDGDGIENFNTEVPKSGLTSEDKRLRLKKRLNSAILIVFVLIILVLLALFHL